MDTWVWFYVSSSWWQDLMERIGGALEITEEWCFLNDVYDALGLVCVPGEGPRGRDNHGHVHTPEGRGHF